MQHRSALLAAALLLLSAAAVTAQQTQMNPPQPPSPPLPPGGQANGAPAPDITSEQSPSPSPSPSPTASPSPSPSPSGQPAPSPPSPPLPPFAVSPAAAPSPAVVMSPPVAVAPSPAPSPSPSPSPSSSPATAPNTAQEQVLLSLKNTFTNGAAKLPSWQQGTDYCTWSGVSCSGTQVTSLVLSGLGLQGTLSEDLGNLSQLQTLNLGSNAITGQLPGSWASGFQSIQQVDLHGNSLSGSLPAAWGTAGNLGSLMTLDLSSNQFSGSLPASWGTQGAFSSLRALDLSDNKFTGTLPAGWGAAGVFSNLNQLNVASNGITGTIPTSWGTSGNLQAIGQLTLKPGNPQLCGSIPANLRGKIQPSSAANGNSLVCSGDTAPAPAPLASAPAVAPAPATSQSGNVTDGVAYLLQGQDLNPWSNADATNFATSLKAALGSSFSGVNVKYLGNVEQPAPSSSGRRLLQTANSATKVYYNIENVSNENSLKSAVQSSATYNALTSNLASNGIPVNSVSLANFNPGGITVPNSGGSGLSQGAKIGIGVGVGLAVLLLLVLCIACCCCAKCCGRKKRTKTEVYQEPIMKVPPQPMVAGGGARSFKDVPTTGAITPGDEYYRRQQGAVALAAPAAVAKPIILNTETAQYQGRSIHDSSIDDAQTGVGGAATASKASKFSSWWSGRGADTTTTAEPAGAVVTPENDFMVDVPLSPAPAPAGVTPPRSGGKVAEWLKPQQSPVRSPGGSGKKKLSELVGDIDTI